MAETTYTYNINDDFPNQEVDTGKLTDEIDDSSIVIGLDHINTSETHCFIVFKDSLPIADATSTLPSIIASHDGEPLPDADPNPRMDDGRMIVRADTRPLNTETYFTSCGDSTAIGDGTALIWDFSDSTSDIYVGPEVPTGYKCKRVDLTFICPLYPKDGAVYFFDAPWGCYISLDIVVPPGNYYPNPAGSIPASSLGLSGDLMYAYASSDVIIQRYVNRHYIYGDCPMGDELNAEGAAVNAIPVGWILRGYVFVPEEDNLCKGFASFETYRCHTTILPGQTVQDIIDSH
jgi:hypothetical protein